MREYLIAQIDNLISQGWKVSKEFDLWLFDNHNFRSFTGTKDDYSIFFTIECKDKDKKIFSYLIYKTPIK